MPDSPHLIAGSTPATPLPLFRTEALAHRSERLQGSVNLALPITWHGIGAVLLLVVVVIAAFLATASYPQIETAMGAIVAESGVATIVPAKPGVIEAVAVREGEIVRPGTPLVRLRADEVRISGQSVALGLLDSFRAQERDLATQSIELAAAAQAEVGRVAASLAGLRQEVSALEAQARLQEQLVAVAEREIEQMRDVAERGFISRRDLQAREDIWLGRRQQAMQIASTMAAKRAAIQEASKALVQAQAQARAQLAGLSASRAEVSQRAMTADAAAGFVIASPIAGRVTALVARSGQAANPQIPLMSVMPAGSTLVAELQIPSSAAGFLRTGQGVRLAIDAFPYQQYGSMQGTISTLSGTTVGRPGPNGTTVPVYLATVALEKPFVQAFGRPQPLMPGMTLQARIKTSDRSLVGWLFQPLFAVARR